MDIMKYEDMYLLIEGKVKADIVKRIADSNRVYCKENTIKIILEDYDEFAAREEEFNASKGEKVF